MKFLEEKLYPGNTTRKLWHLKDESITSGWRDVGWFHGKNNIFYRPKIYTGQDGKQRGKRGAFQAGKSREEFGHVKGG